MPTHRPAKPALPAMRGVRAALALAPAMVLAASLWAPARAQQTELPAGFQDEVVADSLDQPLAIRFLPDGRIILIERVTARVRVVVNGEAATACTVPGVDGDTPEEGLLGLEIDPGWPDRPYVYLQFTAVAGPVVIARFTAAGDLTGEGDGLLTIDPATRRDVLVVPNVRVIHNGGTLRFGPDGKLYSTQGEDGFNCESQRLESLLGKILRLDVSTVPPGPGGAPPLASLAPADNPFAAHPDARARLVWTLGMRNPYGLDIDPVDGGLLIADVGAGEREEVSWAPVAGMNFGWPHWEGTRPHITCPGVDPSLFTPPLFEYDHDDSLDRGEAVIGIAVYRAPPFATRPFPAEYEGNHFFTDHFTGWIRRVQRSGTSWIVAPPVAGQRNAETWSYGYGRMTSGAVGPDGSLYYVQAFSDDRFFEPSGVIRRIVRSGPLDVRGPASPGLSLEPPRPVPSRGHVVLAYSLEVAGPVELALYDAAGRRVRLLVHDPMPAGRREVRWDGRDDRGRPAPAGVYFARLVAGDRSAGRRFPLVR